MMKLPLNEQQLSQGTLQEKMDNFKSDPLLMDVATKFVNEIIEKAKEEALKRMKDKNQASSKGETGIREQGPFSFGLSPRFASAMQTVRKHLKTPVVSLSQVKKAFHWLKPADSR